LNNKSSLHAKIPSNLYFAFKDDLFEISLACFLTTVKTIQDVLSNEAKVLFVFLRKSHETLCNQRDANTSH